MTDDDRDRDRDLGRGRDKRDRGPKEVDLASDKSMGWRFVKNFFAMIANDLGRRGYSIGAVQAALAAIEKVIGEDATGTLLFPGIAAVVQSPAILKNAVRAAGLPEQVNGLIDEVIDDLVEGLRQGYMTKGKLSPSDANQALERAKDGLSKKLDKATFADAVNMLPVDPHQKELHEWLSTLSPEKLKQFEFYRTKLTNPMAVATLLARPRGDRLAALQRLYGDPPKPSAAINVVKSVTDAVTKKFGEGVKGLVDDPEAALKGVAKEIAKGTRKAKKKAKVRDQRLEELKNRR